MKRYFLGFLIFIAIFGFKSCKNPTSEKDQLIIFHAGSLSVPFKEMKEKFEAENPNVHILLEAAGSVQCARKITDLKKECDMMASADYAVIDQMLIPEYASWNIQFASNEMAIVYHDDSKYSDIMNDKNWYEILLRDDVIFGRSDPNSDPCGYRAILTTQLAEKYYKIDGLSEKIKTKDTKYIRPKEVDLIALLESNAIDYIFLYRSVAEQHQLKYVILPDSINLKNSDYNEFYKTVSTDIVGKEPGTTITQTGKAMVYGITILDNAPNKELAEKFLQYALSENGGKQIMEKNGQPFIRKVHPNYKTNLPESLKKYFK
jgi:molybdate/tungstate transport system substrate-binding protein